LSTDASGIYTQGISFNVHLVNLTISWRRARRYQKRRISLWISGPTGPWQDQTIAWPTHPRKADTPQRIVTTYYGIRVLPPL